MANRQTGEFPRPRRHPRRTDRKGGYRVRLDQARDRRRDRPGARHAEQNAGGDRDLAGAFDQRVLGVGE